MPITQSAKKALRQNTKRREQNAKNKKAMKDAVKKYRKLVLQKKTEEAKQMLPKVYQVLDKNAKRGVIKKNTADRLKSRLTVKISK